MTSSLSRVQQGVNGVDKHPVKMATGLHREQSQPSLSMRFGFQWGLEVWVGLNGGEITNC